ncbi:MAG: hypothetical protein AB8G05_20740 [Oligoflexales bacterium]
MFRIFITLLSITAYSLNAYSSNCEQLNPEYPSDSNNFKNYLILKNHDESGNQFILHDNYLALKSRETVLKIFGLDDLVKEEPKKFLKLLIEAIPHTQETIVNDLETFCSETFPSNQLINGIPLSQTPEHKLATIFTELTVWEQIKDQVGDQVRSQVYDKLRGQVNDRVWTQIRAQIDGEDESQDVAQVEDHIWAPVEDMVDTQIKARVGLQLWTQVGDQVWRQIRHQLGDHVWAQIENQVRNHIREEIKDQVWDHIKYQVEDLVDAQLKEDLQQFKFEQAYQDGDLNDLLIPAIDYTFAVYQLGTIEIRHSQEFKNIQKRLAQFIGKNMSKEQIKNLLNSIQIPENLENHLIKTQLDFLRRPLIDVNDNITFLTKLPN